jgi:uncharacterized protein involved in outer membrane biogenesis
MRKLGIALSIIVLVVVIAALALPHLIDVNKYHGQIQAQLEKKLGRQVSLGEMKLSIFPLAFQVANPVVAEDKSFDTGRPFATAQNLSVSVKILPLLHKDVEVKSLSLDRPQIELVRNAGGEWNFATLGQPPRPSPSQASTAAPKPQQPAAQPAPAAAAQPQQNPQETKSAGELTLADLKINDGQLAITDFQKHQSRAVYDHIDVSVSNFAPDSEFSLKVAAHLPGQGKQTVALEGKGGPIKQADLVNTTFDGTLHLNQVSIAGVEKFLNSQALSGIEATISGDSKVKNSDGKLASSGTLRLDDARIHNTNVGYPITLDYDVADDLNSDLIEIHRGNIKLGSTPVTLVGTLNSKPTPAQVDMKLTAANASIGDAARLASAFGVAFGQGMTVNGNVNADLQAKGDLTKPVLNGQLSARDLTISGKDLPQLVKVNDIELALTPDAIRSNDFAASTGSTTVTVNFALAQYTAPTSSVNASLRTANARVGELLNIAKAYGISAVEGMSGDGVLNLDVKAQGPIKNPNAMTFAGTGKLQNASLKLPSMTKPVAIRNADLNFSQNSAALANLAASVGQTNATGSMTLKNFAQPQVQFTLNADKVNVAELQQIMNAAPAEAPKRAAEPGGFWRLTPRANAQTASSAQNKQPGILDKMTGGGAVSIGTVEYDQMLLSNVRSNVSINHGVVTMNPLTSQLYGGQENGTVTIDMRSAQPVYTVNLKTDKVDANKLISSVSSIKEMIYGLLASNVNATFSSTSADSIARGLNGTLALNLTNGKLANLDLLRELAAVGKFVGGLPGAPKGFTNLVQLSGTFDVKNGVAQTNDLKAVIDGGTLAATGTVNLADQELDLHVTAVLSKTASQQAGGTQIGGLMNTALANNQGELVMPVILTGTFQHPQVTPDLQQVAQMKMKNLLPTSGNPGALTNGVVNAITGKGKGGIGGILGNLSGQQNQSPQQNAPASGNNAGQQPTPQNQNPFGNALDQVLGKKNQQQNPNQQPTPK